VVNATRKIAALRQQLGDKKGALKDYEAAVAVSQDLVKADPTNVQASMGLVILFREIGDLIWDMNDQAGAITQYRRAAGILENLSAAEPGNVVVRGRYAAILVMLGQSQAEAGKPAAARPNTIRGLSITRELAERKDATADDLSEYAYHFIDCEPADLREPATALKYAKQSIAKGATGPEYLDILARAYFLSGDVTQAIATEEKALVSLPNTVQQAVSPMRSRIEDQLAKFKASRH
jgi:tetratricopeptide (TPR) repeat protein